MKYLIKSFLFFFVIIQIGFFYDLNSQEVDSTSYYVKLINNPKQNKDLIGASKYFKQQKKIHLKQNSLIKAVYDLTYIARVQKKIGLLYDSEQSVIEALRLLDHLGENKNDKYRIPLYNHLGTTSKELSKYNKALDYYDKILEIEKDPKAIADVLNNKGNVHSLQKKYERAIDFYIQSYNTSLTTKNNSKQIARAKDNMGVVQSKLNWPEALSNMLEALDLRKEKKFPQGIITSYLHLAEYYSDRDSISKAKFYAEQAFNMADSSNILNYKMAALTSVLKLNKNPRFKAFIMLNDSLKSVELLNNNKYAAEKYNYYKKEKELVIAERELVITEKELLIRKARETKLIVGLAFLIMAASFLYFLLKSKHKKDKLQQVYNTETRISKKVHDEVANDVYQVMTQLQSEPKINESVMDNLDHIYSKTRDISKEHSVLDFKEPYQVILKDLLLGYSSEAINVVAKDISKVDWRALSEIKKVTTYKVLQEFMINMKKHSRASVAVLTFKQTKKKITITYSDNGIGTTIKKNTGLQNVENRIKSINGTVIFESEINKGFKANITI